MALSIRVKEVQPLDDFTASTTARRAEHPYHMTLEARLTEFYGLPTWDIPREAAPEFDWGSTRGNEVFN